MLKIHSSSARMALMASVALALGACAKKDAATTDSGMAATADTGMKMGDTAMAMAPPPAAAMSDANIFYALDNVNVMDSAGGAIASTKGSSADVRAFGKDMMRDHHAMRKEGQDLAKKLAITPEAPANDTSKAHMDKEMAMFNGAAKGKDFDKTYIDAQVNGHKAVLEMATSAMSAAQNAELKNMIQKAAPKVQAHLDKAESIQSKMQ